MIARRLSIGALALGLLLAGPHGRVAAFPVDGDQTTLPPKTELNEDALDKPREVFHSEFAGGKSYMVNLGNLAFSSPGILGGVARQAGVSCGTCHVNGAGNAKFFMPKMSTRPGNFDTTGPLFNPKADNQVLDPVRIPSLRGARYLAPYGNDGRCRRCAISFTTSSSTSSPGPNRRPASSMLSLPTSRISISCRTRVSAPPVA